MDDAQKIRNAWINRPIHEMNVGLAEWSAMKSGATTAPLISDRKIADTIKIGNKAQGRAQHTPGTMNGLEKRYAAQLNLRALTGEIREWRFEAIKLRLAPSTFYSPDFMIVNLDGSIELHETKGHWEDDSRVKIKVAARTFPELIFVGVMWVSRTKIWKFEEFHA